MNGFYEWLLFKTKLLDIAADANKVDEMIYSPDINPNNPAVNMNPVKISLVKSFILVFSSS